MSAPLDGILVISLEQAVAAPLASSRLADAGARVIKVEREGGDFGRAYDRAAKGESAFFVWLNRGKESIVLDFKQPEDAALLHRMLARADVLLQNLAPGAAARAGFGSEALRWRYPRLVTCDISGYGESGPYREMRAYDMLVQAESGLISVTGTPEVPGRIGVSACDIGTGQNAFAGILEALFQRERTGKGAGVAVTMFDSMADWMTVPLLMFDYNQEILRRTGLIHPLIAPYGAFRVKGGGELLLSIQNEREWRRFVETVLEKPELLERPEFRTNAERLVNREALHREIDAVFSAVERPLLEERLRRAQIAYGAVNTVAEVTRHPALRRIQVDTPAGPIAMPAPPIRFKDGDPPEYRPVPVLGAHSAALRDEFTE
jgi:crotonobetainyl-CoA:carnitine CoA-transferase CaiB-like acyl-CoA transferase